MENKEKFENEQQKLQNNDDVVDISTDEIEVNEVDEVEEKIYQIDIKMQELLVNIEKIEGSYSPEQFDELDNNEEYKQLQEQYKKLNAEKKQILKEERSKEKSKLAEVSIWVIIYGIISFIISFPLVTLSAWTDFAIWLLDIFAESFANLNTDGFLHDLITFLIIFSLPLLINLITWLVHNNFIKSKTDRKVFVGFWIVQALMSIGVIIYMCRLLYGA